MEKNWNKNNGRSEKSCESNTVWTRRDARNSSMRIKRDQATVVSDGFDTFIDMHVRNVQTTMADAHYNVPF